jgi:hypothetical protein
VSVRFNADKIQPGESQPAILTMHGMTRWLHGPRHLVDVTGQSVELLTTWEPRFHALPVVSEKPWMRGAMFRLGKGTAMEILVYIEPLEGEHPGVRYITWYRLPKKQIWGTVLPKGGPVDQLDTYTYMDYVLQSKSMLGIAEDGTRIDLDLTRAACLNALAAMFEAPNIVHGTRSAPTARGKEGPIHRVKRLTLNEDGARLVTTRWSIEDAETKARSPILHRPHASPSLHVVNPHHWKVWVNKPRFDEHILETRKRARKDETTFVQYLVARLRGKNGPYSRGGELQPKIATMVTGIDDL